MAYALVLPPRLLAKLARIRGETGISIRQQILLAVAEWIEAAERSRTNGSYFASVATVNN